MITTYSDTLIWPVNTTFWKSRTTMDSSVELYCRFYYYQCV